MTNDRFGESFLKECDVEHLEICYKRFQERLQLKKDFISFIRANSDFDKQMLSSAFSQAIKYLFFENKLPNRVSKKEDFIKNQSIYSNQLKTPPTRKFTS